MIAPPDKPMMAAAGGPVMRPMEAHDVPIGATVLVVLSDGCFWGVVKSHGTDTEGHALYRIPLDGADYLWHRASLLWDTRLAAAPAHALSQVGSRA